MLDGPPRSGLGETIAAPGDLDGDGTPDLIVPFPGLDRPADSRTGTWVLLSGAGGQNPNM